VVWAGSLRAQYDIADPPLNIRWSFAFGPSTATSSGRTVRLQDSNNCFSCPKTEEVVSGADRGLYHVALAATGAPSRFGLALRLELMFNRNTSDPYIAPAPTCAQLRCTQRRKAELDDAYMFVGALDFAPLDKKLLSPYVTLGGGFGLNRVKWRLDSSTTSDLKGNAIAFGPFAAVGGGVRATLGMWAASIEWRHFVTFVTPGSQMAPLSFGVQYRPKRSAAPGA